MADAAPFTGSSGYHSSPESELHGMLVVIHTAGYSGPFIPIGALSQYGSVSHLIIH